jgi:DNA-binding transcriptional LysR family regulator
MRPIVKHCRSIDKYCSDVLNKDGAGAKALPNLTVQQLEYLVAVVDERTWADAAATVGVSPSALSQGLAELERRLGVPLFERAGRRRVLAPAAGPVLDHARTVVAATRDLGAWATRQQRGDQGSLRLGMIDAAAVHHFPKVLRRYRRERPDVELRLSVAPSGALLADLARADLDLVVCVEPPAPIDGVEWSPLRTESLSVFAPSDVPTAMHRDWGPWVTFPRGSHTRSVIAAALRSVGAPFDVVAESHQPDVLREMVLLGLGWTVLPTVQAAGLTPVRATPLANRSLVVARRIAAAPLPAADALITTLRSAR